MSMIDDTFYYQQIIIENHEDISIANSSQIILENISFQVFFQLANI